jgi:hypothetical protein
VSEQVAIAAEIVWRLKQFEELQQMPTWPVVPYNEVTGRGLHAGQRGIYRDINRTGSIVPDGIAVGLLHTGKHYSDELTDSGIVYHYPRTKSGTTDEREIQSLRNAALSSVPVFVISSVPGGNHVNLGWIENQDSAVGVVFLTFQQLSRPGTVDVAWSDPEQPLELTTKRKRTQTEVEKAERDPRFKYMTLCRYSATCAVTALDIPTLLEAAHVVPVAKGGSDDPRNGLLLSPTAHRAFDRNLWAIQPQTLELVASKQIDRLPKLRFQFENLRHLKFPPARGALEWRWDEFQKAESKT